MRDVEQSGAAGVGVVFPLDAPASALQRRLALAVAVVLVAGTALIAVQAERRGPGDEFAAACNGAFVALCAVAALLFHDRYRAQRARGLLLLAAGYSFVACAAVLHAVLMPRLADPAPLLLALVVATGAAMQRRWRAQSRLDHVLALVLCAGVLAGVLGLVLGGAHGEARAATLRHAAQALLAVAAAGLAPVALLIEHGRIAARQAEIESAARRRTESLGRLAHELRTPLNAIVGFSELMKDGLAGDMSATQRQFAARIHESGLRLLDLIHASLEAPRSEAAATRTAPEPVAPTPAQPQEPTAARRRAVVIEDDAHAAELLRLHLEDAGFEVQCVADPDDLGRATRRAPDLITLDLLLQGKSGWDVLETIRRDPRLAAVPVVICSVLAEQHRGFAVGASMVLQKPVSRETLHAALDGLHLGGGGAKPATVLVVDDDPMAVELVAIHLEDRRVRVLRAHDGASAVAMAREAHPDLMVLDLMMPGFSGFEVVEAVRSDPGLAAMPILVMSAKALTHDDRARLEGHVMQVIDKAGFDRDRFLAEVGRALRAT